MEEKGISIPDFGKRLEHLMTAAGYDVTKRGTDRKLSKAMHAAGCLPVNEKISMDATDAAELLEKSIDNNRKVIGTHRKAAAPPSTEWIMAYCRFFRCSADYLLGYIDGPTHEAVEIERETGLSEASVDVLRRFAELIREEPGRRSENERKVLQALNYLLGGDLSGRSFPEWRLSPSGRFVGRGKRAEDFGLLALIFDYVAASHVKYISGEHEDDGGGAIKAESAYFMMKDGRFVVPRIDDLYRRAMLDRIRDELNRLQESYQE